MMSVVERRVRRGWILVSAALILSACGGAKKASSPPSGHPRQVVQVSEKEFAITPNAIHLSQPQDYSFHITNVGTITHAFTIQGNGVDAKTGNIAPGGSATLSVRLGKNGSYTAYCPIDGHRSRGMQTTITVGKAPLSGPGTTSTTPTTTSNPGY
jgi:uncharacterized cupredoxin-like copper-binding protein